MSIIICLVCMKIKIEYRVEWIDRKVYHSYNSLIQYIERKIHKNKYKKNIDKMLNRKIDRHMFKRWIDYRKIDGNIGRYKSFSQFKIVETRSQFCIRIQVLDIQINRKKYREIYIKIDRKIYRKIDRKIYRKIDKKIYRKIDKKI